MKKYLQRSIWYACVPFLLWIGMLLLQPPVANVFVDVLVAYLPLSVFFFLYFKLISYDLCHDRIVGYPTKHVLLTMAAAGCIIALIAVLSESETLAAIGMIVILAGIDGLITERERIASQNAEG